MLKILSESKTLHAIMPLTKIEEIQLSSFQNGIHPTFDAFDRTNPDAFICKGSVLDRTIIKNLKERPHLRIIIVDDSKDGTKMLSSEIGDVFEVISDLPICDLDACVNASSDESLKTEVFCSEGVEFSDLPNWSFEKAKIFSSIGFVDHLSFCGILPPEKRFNGYKSCKYALVQTTEWANAVMCGAIPIHDNSLVRSTPLTKDEAFSSLTNYDFTFKVLRMLEQRKEADKILAMKNWIGATV